MLVARTPEAIDGDSSEAVFDVTSPTMTVFPPAGTNTGVAMIVFPGSAHHWDDECQCSVTPTVPRALQDAQRTISLASNILAPAYEPVDGIDRTSSRPDFAVALYPGHLCRAGRVLDPGMHVTRRTPPTFLLQAWDDPVTDTVPGRMR